MNLTTRTHKTILLKKKKKKLIRQETKKLKLLF